MRVHVAYNWMNRTIGVWGFGRAVVTSMSPVVDTATLEYWEAYCHNALIKHHDWPEETNLTVTILNWQVMDETPSSQLN